MREIRAVLFDVFGTVVDWRAGIIRDVEPFLLHYGDARSDPAAFADAWRGRYQPAMERVRAGQRPFVRLDVLHREMLEETLAEFAIDVTGIDPLRLAWLNHAWHRLDPWPDVLIGLERLRAHFIIAPLSNGNVVLMLDIAKRAGLPWDAVLGAELTQAYKPAPAAYLRTAEILSMEPDELCLVAAHNTDLAAARACGLRTAFVPRPLEHGVGQTTDLHPEQTWDFIARDFCELADLLVPAQLP